MIKLLQKCETTARKGVAFELVIQAAKLLKKHYRLIDDAANSDASDAPGEQSPSNE
jgi:hypothetical protein